MSGGSFTILLRLLLRLQLTPLRIVGTLALGMLAIVLGAIVAGSEEAVRLSTEVVAGFGLSLAIPLACAWMATSLIGDLVEDRLLVYLWLKPVPRWQLPTAAVVATVVTVVPLLALPLVVAQVAAGSADLAGSVLVASVLAIGGYAGLFVAAGLWFRRALWWALVYVLVWENGFARAVDGAARFSIASCAQSLVAAAADVHISYADRPAGAAVALPCAVLVVGLALAVIRYRRAEID